MNTSPETGILWYENDMVVSAFKVGLATLVLIVVLLSVVRPVIKSYLPADPVPAPVMLPASMASAREAMESGVAATSQAEQATALASADSTEAAAEAGSAELSLGDGESMEDFKERMKKMAPKKKSSISADMLDTANTYDDKVALVRMLVSEDSGRVATVLKNMIKRDQLG
jgi:flagellar M-ring protein FliF